MANIFSITTLLISVPITEMVFLYIATLYGGSIHLDTPMLWALAFIAEFMIGGVTGIFLGSSGTDIYLHDTYFLIAHFHYTFVPIAIIAVFAGLTFWYPKMFGRMLNETLGKIHFWGTVIPFNVIFIPLFITGIAGDQRRVYNYAQFAEQSRPASAASAHHVHDRAAFHAGFPVGLFVQFLLEPAPRQDAPDANPWRSTTLEWTVPSPPPHGNFAEMPTVYRGPYEYGLPGRADDFLPQNVPD